jgi:hypothetical protein
VFSLLCPISSYLKSQLNQRNSDPHVCFVHCRQDHLEESLLPESHWGSCCISHDRPQVYYALTVHKIPLVDALIFCEQVPAIKMFKEQELSTSGLLGIACPPCALSSFIRQKCCTSNIAYLCFPPSIYLNSEVLLVKLEFRGALPIKFVAQFV